MKRNSALLWTAISTLLCGWPGAFLVTLGILDVFTPPQNLAGNAVFLLGGLIMLALAIIVAFRTFRASQGSGITGLTLMAALTGVLLCGTAGFLFVGIGAATTTTGMVEAVMSLGVASVLMLVSAAVLWFTRSRVVPPAVEAPRAPIPPE